MVKLASKAQGVEGKSLEGRRAREKQTKQDRGSVRSRKNLTQPPADLCRKALHLLKTLRGEGAFLFVPKNADQVAVFGPSNAYKSPLLRAALSVFATCRAHDLIEPARGSSGEQKKETTRFTLSVVGRQALARWEAAASRPNADEEDVAQAQHRAYARISIAAEKNVRAAGARESSVETRRANIKESPLAWLARRRGANGAAFLTAAEVEAGERLRADFEAANLGLSVTQNWSRFLAVVDEGPRRSGAPGLDGAPAQRVSAAFTALGPGLSDVALRVCCFVDGLEAVERDLGWASRSGKVVLKIALQRLVVHYGLDRTGLERPGIEVWRAGA